MSLRSTTKLVARRTLKGASWQLPVVRGVLPVLDVADAAVRGRRGLAHLPPYSRRIRSNGVGRQFGGREFVRSGAAIADQLERHAGLRGTSSVLEIGCGVGRVALALATRHPGLHFTGVDVDAASIESCRANPLLRDTGFTFDVIDVESDLYNPHGGQSAATYRLPYADDAFDVVYLISVFTHMLEAECANYAAEVRRVLRPGGRTVVTGFVIEAADAGSWERRGEAYLRAPTSPRKMVGYELGTFERWFGGPPVRSFGGTWRGRRSPDLPDRHADFQDMLIFAVPL
jgi:SAM-dependent methyltransferase